jgi:hypothetical protein
MVYHTAQFYRVYYAKINAKGFAGRGVAASFKFQGEPHPRLVGGGPLVPIRHVLRRYRPRLPRGTVPRRQTWSWSRAKNRYRNFGRAIGHAFAGRPRRSYSGSLSSLGKECSPQRWHTTRAPRIRCEELGCLPKSLQAESARAIKNTSATLLLPSKTNGLWKTTQPPLTRIIRAAFLSRAGNGPSGPRGRPLTIPACGVISVRLRFPE